MKTFGKYVLLSVAGLFALLVWGHLRANALEARILASCDEDDIRGHCISALDSYNAEVGFLGRSMASTPILNPVYKLIYERDEPLRDLIPAEVGLPDLFDRAG